MFRKLDDNEIESLITTQLIGRLGCHADGVTYIVPISYAYDGEYLYLRTFEGQKLNMLRKNPDVCFQTDDTKDLSNWKSVICWGYFEELHNDAERRHAIGQLSVRVLPPMMSETMQISPSWPFVPVDLNEIKGIFCRIKLREKTGRCEITSFPALV